MKIRPWPYFCEIYLMRTGKFIRKRTSTMKASCVLTSFLFQPMPFEKVCSFVFVTNCMKNWRYWHSRSNQRAQDSATDGKRKIKFLPKA